MCDRFRVLTFSRTCVEVVACVLLLCLHQMAGVQTVNLFNLMNICSSVNETVHFLREYNILKRSSFCDVCGEWMSHVYDQTKIDKYTWRCRSCRRKISIRHNSFFFQQTAPLGVYLCLLFLFAKQIDPTQALALLEGKVSRNTIYDWYNFYRGIISRYLVATDIQIGGPGLIVEVDESKWGKKPKYHRGFVAPDKPWVFGAICRESQKVVLSIVQRRTKEDLQPLIQEHIRAGSVIHSDDWRAYRGIDQLGFTHRVVIHAHNFVDPNTGVHTNQIEGFWAHAKKTFKQMHGVPNEHIGAHLDEVMFRWNEKDTDVFNFLLQHIAEYYNPNDIVPPNFQHLVGQEPEVRYNELED